MNIEEKKKLLFEQQFHWLQIVWSYYQRLCIIGLILNVVGISFTSTVFIKSNFVGVLLIFVVLNILLCSVSGSIAIYTDQTLKKYREAYNRLIQSLDEESRELESPPKSEPTLPVPAWLGRFYGFIWAFTYGAFSICWFVHFVVINEIR